MIHFKNNRFIEKDFNARVRMAYFKINKEEDFMRAFSMNKAIQAHIVFQINPRWRLLIPTTATGHSQAS